MEIRQYQVDEMHFQQMRNYSRSRVSSPELPLQAALMESLDLRINIKDSSKSFNLLIITFSYFNVHTLCYIINEEKKYHAWLNQEIYVSVNSDYVR